MSETDGARRRKGRVLNAGEILALHADHRRGRHPSPVADCTQCMFDALDGTLLDPQLLELLGDAAEA